MNDLVQDLLIQQRISYITVASTALIFHDWILTSHEEFNFVWRRGRSLYGRTLFVGARYAALAQAILAWIPAVAKQDNFMTWLAIITIICSELIFATRTWAIWERSRPILIFLIGLFIVCVSLGITMTEIFDFKDLVAYQFTASSLHTVTSPITVIIDGVGQYQISIITVKYAWVIPIPYICILVFQSVMVVLTLYRLLRYRSNVPKELRSTLADVLWIDGIMYFVFMFIVGVLNVVFVALSVSESHPHLPLEVAQLQTVLHSVLSTRVTLHTATVLRQDLIDSRATVAQNQCSNSIRFAEVTTELVPEDVEVEEAQR